jgi:hypothetical protein
LVIIETPIVNLVISKLGNNVVSVRMKKNSATVHDMGSRTKREGHGVNPRFRSRVKEGSSDRDNVLSKQGCSNREKWEY